MSFVYKRWVDISFIPLRTRFKKRMTESNTSGWMGWCQSPSSGTETFLDPCAPQHLALVNYFYKSEFLFICFCPVCILYGKSLLLYFANFKNKVICVLLPFLLIRSSCFCFCLLIYFACEILVFFFLLFSFLLASQCFLMNKCS